MDQCWKCGHAMTVIKSEPYRYTECGLDNVFLYGIVQSRCPKCGEEVVTVPNIKGLHLAIARNLVCKEEMLTGDEIPSKRVETEKQGDGGSPFHETGDLFPLGE
jgi:hypothetical protein